MAIVLEECSTEEQRSVVRFLWAKVFNAKGIHKEMFPVYGGKCVTRKAVHNWVEKFYQGRSKVADDARLCRPVEIATEAMWLRQQSKYLYAAGFDALVKQWDRSMNVGGGYIGK
jgi:hypothetical protein